MGRAGGPGAGAVGVESAGAAGVRLPLAHGTPVSPVRSDARPVRPRQRARGRSAALARTDSSRRRDARRRGLAAFANGQVVAALHWTVRALRRWSDDFVTWWGGPPGP